VDAAFDAIELAVAALEGSLVIPASAAVPAQSFAGSWQAVRTGTETVRERASSRTARKSVPQTYSKGVWHARGHPE
jgi:hypothetical protein